MRTLRLKVLKPDTADAELADPSQDDLLESAIHMAAFDGERVVSVVRALPLHDDPTVYSISRMATDEGYRGRGIGRKVMMSVEDTAKEAGAKYFALYARPTAIGFYERLGYKQTSEFNGEEPLMVKEA